MSLCLWAGLYKKLSLGHYEPYHNFWTVMIEISYLHTYSTNETLSNDSRVIDLVSLTLILKIAISDFVASLGFSFHKHILFANRFTLIYMFCPCTT